MEMERVLQWLSKAHETIFYHLEHYSFNGYNAAKQYGHFYNEDNFMLGHSSATKAPILRCINTVAMTLNCDSNIMHQAGKLR